MNEMFFKSLRDLKEIITKFQETLM